MSMKSTEVRRLAEGLAAEANELTVALYRGRLLHTCGGDPAKTVGCSACDIDDDKRAERRCDV